MAYSSKNKPVLVETGDYEVEIINADIRTTANGTQYLNLAFKINDIGLVVYDKIWRDYNVPTDFNHKRVAQLLTALKFSEDEELEGDYALITAIKNKKLIVSVTKEYNDKTQKEENNVKDYKALETTPSVDVNEDDLPF